MKAKSLSINISGVGPVLLERSAKAKNLNISVKPFKGIRVAVPKGMSFNKAEQITQSKIPWLKVNLDKMMITSADDIFKNSKFKPKK